MRILAPLAFALLALPAMGDTVVAARTIRAQTLLAPADVRLEDVDTAGAYTALEQVLGSETRVALYAGRPILSGEVGPPAIVERNQVVTLLFQQGGLEILAEGRALGRAGAGDKLRVMNLESRQTITGRVRADGVVLVGPAALSLLTQ